MSEEAWIVCPRCDSGGYHLLGERGERKTGLSVKSLLMVGEVKIGVVRDGDPPDTMPLQFAEFDCPVVVDQRERECRNCGHIWQQRLGDRIVRPSFDERCQVVLVKEVA